MSKGVYVRTSEYRAKMSNAMRNSDAAKAQHETMRGVPKSPETCAALSVARRNSDAAKDNVDAMRGGNDIVGHHIIYDHADLSKNVMKMTRSMHQQLHRLFQKHGIEIPNINVEV